MARQGFFSRLFRRRPKAAREHDASARRRAGRRSEQRGQPAAPLPLSEPAAPTAVDGSEAVGSETGEPWYRQSGPLFDTSFSDSPTPARPPGGGGTATDEFAPPRAADPAATAATRSVPMIQRVGQVTDPGPLPERMRGPFDPPSNDGEATAAGDDPLAPAAEASEAVSATASGDTPASQPAETEADGAPRQHGNSSPWAPPTAAERSEPGIGLDETADGIGHGSDSPEPLIDFSDPEGATASSGGVPTEDMSADETSDDATGEDIPATDDDAMPEPERLGTEDATGAPNPEESGSTATPEDLTDSEGVLPASVPPSEIAQHEPPMVVPVRGYYIARTEDTLRSVAAQFLNAPERWSELRTLNAAYPGITGLDPDELLPEGAALALPGDPLPWGRPDPVYLWTLAETFLFTAWGREPTPEEVVPFWRGLTQGALPEAAQPPLGNELPGIAEIAARGGDSAEKPSQDAAPLSPPSAFEMPAVAATPAEAPDGEAPHDEEQGETTDLDAGDDSEPDDIAGDEGAGEAASAEAAEDAMPAAGVAALPDDAMPTPTLPGDDEDEQATPAASEPDEATWSTPDHTEPAPGQAAAAMQTEQPQPAEAAAFEVESLDAPPRDDAQPETLDSEAAADIPAGAVEAPPADIGTIEPADSDDAVEEASIAEARIVEDTAPETVEDTAVEPEAEPAPDEPLEAEHGIEESAHAEPQIAEPPHREPQPADPPDAEPVAAQVPPAETPPPVYADPAAETPQPPSAYVGAAPSPAPEAPTAYVAPEPPPALEPPPTFDEWPDEPTMPPADPLAPYAGMPGMGTAEAPRPPEAEAPRVPHFLPSVTGTTPSGLTTPVQSSPVGRSLAGTAVGDAMLLWQLARRRRQSQRAAGMPDAFEQSLLQSAGSESLELIEAAMRHLRAVTVGQQRPKPDVLAVRSGTYGFEVLLHRPVPTPPGWRSASGGYVLELPQGVTARDLSAVGQGPSLCPALVPVGNTFEGPLLLNLEQVGCLAVSGPRTAAAGLLSAIVSTLGSSPMAGHLRITAVGFESEAGMIGWEGVAFTSYDSPELESLLANAYGAGDGMIELLVIGPGNDLLIQRAGQVSAAPESRLSLVGATSVVSARWPWRIHVDDTGTAVVHPISITMTAARAVTLEAPAPFGGPTTGGVGPAGLQ